MGRSTKICGHNRLKGYFYSIDALIAITIVTVGLILVLQGSNVGQVPRANVFLYSEDLTNYLSHTKIYDLNDDNYPTSIKIWKQNGSISFIDNTLLEQAGEFYTKGDLATMEHFLSNVTEVSVSLNYNFLLRINNSNVYIIAIIPESKAKTLIAEKLIISGFLDSQNTWGPYMAEVRVWQ